MTPAISTIVVISFGLVGSITFLCLLLAQASPLLIIYFSEKYSEKQVESAKRHVGLSILVFTFLLAKVSDISFTSNGLNSAIVVIVVVVSMFLALFSFELRPTRIGELFGIGAFAGSILLAIFLLFLPLTIDSSPKSAELENGIYCRQSEYGSAVSQNGSTIKVFRRYFFLDKLEGKSDSNDEAFNDQNGEVVEAIKRCKLELAKTAR